MRPVAEDEAEAGEEFALRRSAAGTSQRTPFAQSSVSAEARGLGVRFRLLREGLRLAGLLARGACDCSRGALLSELAVTGVVAELWLWLAGQEKMVGAEDEARDVDERDADVAVEVDAGCEAGAEVRGLGGCERAGEA